LTTKTNDNSGPRDPLAYSPQDFCDATGLSRQTLYRMMRTGEITFVKARRRTLIPATEIYKLLGDNRRA
jgi:excisionase family DNA binding protein